MSSFFLRPNSPVTPVGTPHAPSPRDYRNERSSSNRRVSLRSYQPQDSCVPRLQPKPGWSPKAHFKHCLVVETRLPCTLHMCRWSELRATFHLCQWGWKEVLFSGVFGWFFKKLHTDFTKMCTDILWPMDQLTFGGDLDGVILPWGDHYNTHTSLAMKGWNSNPVTYKIFLIYIANLLCQISAGRNVIATWIMLTGSVFLFQSRKCDIITLHRSRGRRSG